MSKYNNYLDTLVGRLSEYANQLASKQAFVFVNDEIREIDSYTYEQLECRVKSVASELLKTLNPGDRAILCYPPGLDYIVGFYACLYAGIVAVPVYPPQGRASTARFTKVMSSCDASIILTCSILRDPFIVRIVKSGWIDIGQVLFTDEFPDACSSDFRWPDINCDTLAFLQYTSGSTGDPKGVMITHGNIIANLKSLEEATKCRQHDVFVNWLPLFHDLGLVNTMLLPVFLGAQSVLMSPMTFVNLPLAWLAAMSKYRGTIAGGPNFCFELCLKKINKNIIHQLDLRHWRIAFNAAEPIHEKTLENFAATFASVGFKKEAFYPSYGMAEATVYLTGRQYDESLTAQNSDQGKRVVACGGVTSDHAMCVVDPDTMTARPDGQVGEVWVQGPSISVGYWANPEKTKETMQATLAGSTNNLPWLRTGDLGFVQNNELYVTGRMKEIIIIRGQNYYPTDIERSAQESHPALRIGGGAAFAVDGRGEEALVLIQEVNRTALRNLNPEEVYEAILASIADEYQLDVSAILLIEVGKLEKTTSGKVQRIRAKEKYLSGEIKCVAQYIKGKTELSGIYIHPESTEEALLERILCQEMELEKVSIDDNFFTLGANSIVLTRSMLALNRALNLDLSIATIFEYPTIRTLANFITSDLTSSSISRPCPHVAIPKLARGPALPLSFAQQRLWFLWQFEGANPAYNESHVFQISSELDCSVLADCFQKLVDRHETLSMRIVENDGVAMQVFDSASPIQLLAEDIATEDELRHILHKESLYPFELNKESLLKLRLLRLSDQYYLCVTMHHIITDGWSMGILVKELSDLYANRLTGVSDTLPEMNIQYADYASWQRQYLQASAYTDDMQYWRKQLKDLPLLHNLPLDNKRPIDQTFIGKKYAQIINGSVTKAISEHCEQQNVTLFMFLHAAFSYLLARYSGESDIVIGSPIAGRTHSDLEGLVGFFVNTLVLRHKIDGCVTFNDFLQTTKSVILKAFTHQSMPFDALANELQPERSVGHSPLVQVVLVLQNNLQQALQLSGATVLKLEDLDSPCYVKNELELSVTECDGELSLLWQYNSALFDRSTIERLSCYFDMLLSLIVSKADVAMADIDLATLIDGVPQTEVTTANEQSCYENLGIHQVFEKQVQLTPDSIAVSCEGENLTYNELNIRANQLANRLVRDEGVANNTSIAIYFERSLDMVVAILAVLKAGCTYVPVDPSNPSARVKYILSDSSAAIILTQMELLHTLPQGSQRRIVTDDPNVAASLRRQSKSNPESVKNAFSADQLAYLIYTSGSTGTPKGVMVSHANVTRLFSAASNVFEFSKDDTWTLFHSYAFDFSVWEIWGALFYGAKLVVVPYWVTRDSEKFLELVRSHGVTVLNQTPTAFEQLLAVDAEHEEPHLGQLRYVIFGGEALEYQALEPWFKRYSKAETKLVNMYGITETTVHVTFYEIQEDDRLMKLGSIIGKPLSDLRTYVLNEYGQLALRGALGELCVAGPGVTQGYLNQAKLSAERFISNPFSDDPADKLYLSGDIVRLRSDGNLEYIGRRDQQVKIRGFRIGLAEIEAALLLHPEVTAAAVTAENGASGSKQLVAHIVTPNIEEYRHDPGYLTRGLDEHLTLLLPRYMVPNIFTLSECLPLTDNGKLDKQALLSLERHSVNDSEYAAPVSTQEKVLTEIWGQLLGCTSVGVNDNFFALGGDSIIAIQVVSHAGQKGMKFGVRDLFKYQTIATLIPYITAVTAKSCVAQAPVEGDTLLLPVQLDFFSRGLVHASHYNQAMLLHCPEGFDFSHLRRMFYALYQRHDALRQRFVHSNETNTSSSQPFSELMLDTTLQFEDIRHLSDEEQSFRIDATCELIQHGLDIGEGPLFKAVLFDCGEGQAQLFITFHHLLVDGVSWRILLADMDKAWKQMRQGKEIVLNNKTASLQTWGAALHHYATESSLQSELKYWLKQLDVTSHSLVSASSSELHEEMPLSVTSYSLNFSKEETSNLLTHCNVAYKTRIDELLLAAFIDAYCASTLRTSLRLDVESHGRAAIFADVDVGETVGWFTAIYPLAVQLKNDFGIDECIREVKERCRKVPSLGIGFGVLKNISKNTELNTIIMKNPSTIVFNYLGQTDNLFSDTNSFQKSKLDTQLASSDQNRPAYALEINSLISDGELTVKFQCIEKELADMNIAELAAQFEESLSKCIAHCLAAKEQLTPSDFDLLCVEQSVIDSVLPKLSNNIGSEAKVSDIYPLSSTQEEILFHGLFSTNSAAYFEQLNFHFQNGLEELAWEQAWQHVIARHAILRSGFDYNNFGQPVQIVFDHVPLPWVKIDLRSLTPGQQSEDIQRRTQAQCQQGFDFKVAPLMQFNLYHLADDAYRFVWNFHHILLDGWSMSLVVSEVLKIYSGLVKNDEVALPSARPFRDYIAWSKIQNKEASVIFWQDYLQGFNGPSKLHIDALSSTSKDSATGVPRIKKRIKSFSPTDTADINKFVRTHGITINALCHASLTMLLQYYSGESDIVFGATCSGRPGELAGVEQSVGMFINTLPARYHINPSQTVDRWLGEIHGEQSDREQYQLLSLAEITKCSSSGAAKLFDCLLVVENYPIDNDLVNSSGILKMQDIQHTSQDHFPLTVAVVLGDKIDVYINYDSARYGDNNISDFLDNFHSVVAALVLHGDWTLAELASFIVKEQGNAIRARTPTLRDSARRRQHKKITTADDPLLDKVL